MFSGKRIVKAVATAVALLGISGWALAQDAAAPAADAAADTAAPAGMKVLKLETPRPMFIGTPKNIKSDNLEKTGTKRDKIFVPEAAVNLALNKAVTSSDNEPIIGELDLITDGDKEGADGSYVELGPNTQWVQIDLGAPSEIFAVALWHFHSQARVYRDVVIQTADDADFITNVKTVFNSDHDNSSGLGVGKDKEYIDTADGRAVDAKGAKARYIRVYSKGNTSNDMNHYIEVEVWGKPGA